ncbi:MAG: hypothetical protein ABI645_11855 [Pseudomonadota bacterium]
MMLPLILAAAATTTAATPPAVIARLSAGLAVTVERIPEPIAVDGVSMSVQRATGPGVPDLVRRIEESWRREGSRIEYLQQEAWKLSSRIHGPISEVLQWRPDANEPELLWSFLNVQASVQSRPAADLVLPAGCVWTRSISGRSGEHLFMQHSAYCPQPISTLSTQLHELLPQQGWQVRRTTDAGFQVDRAGTEGFISLSSPQGNSVTWLTWLRVERGR